jgi:flagella basal body P-ring formation protein FlgA
MSKFTLYLLFSWAFSLFSMTSFAQNMTHQQLENLVKNYVTQKIPQPKNSQLKIQVTPIDPRIKITKCNQPLVLNIPENHNSRNINVQVSCTDNFSWKIYIPVKIITTQAVVIAKQYIAKNSHLTTKNIKVIQKDITKIRGEYYTDITKVIDNKTLKSLTSGAVIAPNNICLVCKGESVIIRASRATFTIKTAGKALTNGILGEYVKVKNSRSGRVISARVSGKKQVEIN